MPDYVNMPPDSPAEDHQTRTGNDATTGVFSIAPPASTDYGVTHSAKMGKLAAAIARAQVKLKNPPLNAQNRFAGNKYATLTVMLDAAREAFASEGIAIVQAPCDDGTRYGCQTMLILGDDEEEQWIRCCTMLLPDRGIKRDGTPNMSPTHATGSAYTYARRYSLPSICGFAAEEDDDGVAASQTPAEPVSRVPAKKVEPPPKKPTKKQQAAADAREAAKAETVKQVIAWVECQPADARWYIVKIADRLKLKPTGDPAIYSAEDFDKMNAHATQAIRDEVPHGWPVPPT